MMNKHDDLNQETETKEEIEIKETAEAETDADGESIKEADNETQEATQAAEAETDVDVLTSEIETLKQQVQKQQDQALRAQAELDNMRKRTQGQLERAHKYALTEFVKALLPVLDSLELGITAADQAEDVTTLREGMELTLKKFSDELEKFGVIPVVPQLGDKFDPEKHEAVTTQPHETAESGTVLDTMQKGYELNGRLLRPAKVIVVK